MWPILAQTAPNAGFRGLIDNLARTPLSQVVAFVAVCTVIRLAVFPYLKGVIPHKRSGAYGGARFLNEAMDAIVYAGVFVFMIIRPFAIQAFLIPTGSMVPTLLVNDFIVANKAVYRYSDPKVGDIVVFRPPARAIVDPSQIDKDGQVNVDFIKRCIGTPGDVVEMRNNVIYRNGVAQPEPFKHFMRSIDPPANTQFVEETPEERAMEPVFDFKLANYHGQYLPVNYTNADINNPEARMPVAREYVPRDGAMADELRNSPPAAVPKGFYLMMGDDRNNSYDGRGWGLVPREAIIGRSEVIWLPFSRWGRTR